MSEHDTDIVNDIIRAVKRADSPVTSTQIFNLCQVVPDRKTLSEILNDLTSKGVLVKNSQKRYSLGKAEEVTKAKPDPVPVKVSPIPENIDSALDEIELAFKPPAIQRKYDPALKVAVLERLASFMHPHVSDVLLDVADEIQQFNNK